MNFLARTMRLLRRLASGTDVLIIRQSAEDWDVQFSKGRWERLMDDEPNTAHVSGLILREAACTEGSVRVLDVGCGSGALARLVEDVPNVTYHGTDISRTAIDSARNAMPDMQFSVSDAEENTEAPAADIVVFNEILYYVDPVCTLERYAQRNPEALVIVSVIRSWRSRLLWRRIGRMLEHRERYTLSSPDGRIWDIVRASFHAV